MATECRRLGEEDTSALRELLESDHTTNLFLLGYLDAHDLGASYWAGVFHKKHLEGVALVVPNRLVVPWIPNTDHGIHMGRYLATHFDPCMMVGPRMACDQIWERWGKDTDTACWYDQRLYVLQLDKPTGELVPGFRPAHPDDGEQVLKNAIEMEFEDLRIPKENRDISRLSTIVRDRIRQMRTFVIYRNGEICFQINIGTSVSWGCQVGGTFVPKKYRNQGMGTEGMRGLINYLSPSTSLMTLHVNEANSSAVRIYEKTGFTRSTPYRLITIPDARGR